VWSQHWLDLLFLHWQVPAGDLRARIPCRLEVDRHGGQAWVSLVLFRLRVRPRWLPFLPGLSGLVEANLRTYVRCGDRPGIWFLSVHADNRWAIALARRLTPMPYVRAAMDYRRPGHRFRFVTWCPTPPHAGLSVQFLPGPEARAVADGTPDAWLLERYRLFILDDRRRLLEAEVAHPRWVVRDVDVTMSANRMGAPVGLDLDRAPDRAHFSEGVRAYFGAFREAEAAPEASPSLAAQPLPSTASP
jgi:uncharacterized protein YqjF (DUF2071 family)